MKAFHSDPRVKQKYVDRVKKGDTADFIVRCLSSGILCADPKTGFVTGRRGSIGTISSDGYLVASIRAFGIRKQVKLHRVVWISSGGCIPPGYVLDHIDRVKTNNSITNLRVVTHAENAKNRRSYSGAKNPSAKINRGTVASIKALHGRGISYSKMANNFGVSKSLIAAIIRGKVWS